MNKTKVRKRNSNSVVNTQIWKNKLVAKGEFLHSMKDCWPLLQLSVWRNWGFGAKDSNT